MYSGEKYIPENEGIVLFMRDNEVKMNGRYDGGREG
jgi:hypothetical protein